MLTFYLVRGKVYKQFHVESKITYFTPGKPSLLENLCPLTIKKNSICYSTQINVLLYFFNIFIQQKFQAHNKRQEKPVQVAKDHEHWL